MPTSKDFSDKDRLALELASQKTKETTMTSLDQLEKKIDELKTEVRSAKEESIYSRVSQEVLNSDIKIAIERIETLRVLYEKNIENQKERDQKQDVEIKEQSKRITEIEKTDKKIVTIASVISTFITGVINAVFLWMSGSK